MSPVVAEAEISLRDRGITEPFRVAADRIDHYANFFLRMFNQGAIRQIQAELDPDFTRNLDQRIKERIRTCELIGELKGTYPLGGQWAGAYTEAFGRGADAMFTLLEQWGVFLPDGTVQVPVELQKFRGKLEWMDHERGDFRPDIRRLGWRPAKAKRFYRGLDKSIAASWGQYRGVKRGALLVPGPGKREQRHSLTSRVMVGATTEWADYLGKPIYYPGGGKDEGAVALGSRDRSRVVVMTNLHLSTETRQMMRASKCESLVVPEGERIDPSGLKPGLYLHQGDVQEGFPFEDGTVVVGGLNIVHHLVSQEEFIAEVIRVAAPLGNGDRAFVIGEPKNSHEATAMVVYLSQQLGHETSAWEALMSYLSGFTEESLGKVGEESNILLQKRMLAPSNLYTTTDPSLPRFVPRRVVPGLVTFMSGSKI